MEEIKFNFTEILIILHKHFQIQASVCWFLTINLIFKYFLQFKNDFDGFIKTIQACEKEIKLKNSLSILLIEKVNVIILFSLIQRIYIFN